MAGKYKLSVSEIENDIKSSIKYPADESRAAYKRWSIPAAILGVALFVIGTRYIRSVWWVFIAMLIFAVVSIIVEKIILSRRIKKVNIDDYEIKLDTMSHKSSETYRRKTNKYYSETIGNHSLYFKDSGEWRVQKKNYLWNGEFWMSGFAVYDNAGEGDSFIVVLNKQTGKIATAYSLELFEYKE